jgi:flagellar motor protein MotB
MPTLIDSLTNLVAPATGQIAAKLGESEAAVASGMTSAFGAVLGALVYKTRDPVSFGQIFDVISSAPPSTNLAGDLQTAIGTLGATGSGATNSATNVLGMLFGDRTNAVAELIGRTTRFKNPTSASALLSFAVPVVLNFLGKKIHDEGLHAASLPTVLSSERASIVAAAPPAFMYVLESSPRPARVEEREIERTATPADRPYVGDTRAESSARGKRLWVAVGVAAVVLAGIAISVSRPHRAARRVSASVSAMDTSANRAGRVIDTAGGEVSANISGLGSLGKRRLPNGLIIDVPAYGMESRVIGFIEGPQTANQLATFDFDRLSFAPGTAEILPESQDQLRDVAAIMRAYPGMTVKVAGYSDNAGSPSTNLKLSQHRANAVKQALVASGIASSRITTEAGGVRNRRVALEITHK